MLEWAEGSLKNTVSYRMGSVMTLRAALTDEKQTVQQLRSRTGLSHGNIAMALTYLRHKGEVERVKAPRSHDLGRFVVWAYTRGNYEKTDSAVQENCTTSAGGCSVGSEPRGTRVANSKQLHEHQWNQAQKQRQLCS